MKQAIKNLIRQTLKKFNIGITSYTNLQRLTSITLNRRAGEDIEFLLQLPDDKITFAIRNLCKSRAQLRQDLFVLSELDFKRDGFFVEFGAANGVDLSNTYLLEKEFGWTGILAEPALCWHSALRQNRSCRIDTRCVWSNSDSTLMFNEVEPAELSTIDSFSKTDYLSAARNTGAKYEVNTITLADLLQNYDAPKEIDYLSIDTEGSEFEILANFDFERYRFKVITCEHAFRPLREQLHSLMTSRGYIRKFEDCSYWDDWYVRL